ncbi:hypothetical protein AHAS_Ahas15G0277300 [Arachis hypogaea]
MYIKGPVLIESLGIPCDHIAALVLHLDFMEIPMSLVLKRWSKNARSKVRRYVDKGPFCWDSMINLQRSLRRYSEITRLKLDTEVGHSPSAVVSQSSTLEGCVQDLLVVRRKKRLKRTQLTSNRRLGQQPSHEDDVDEDNYYTPNFGEEVDEVYAHYHSQPMEQEEHFSPDEEETDPYYSWHK